MNISYEGVGYLAVTMPTNGCDDGHVCNINEEGKVYSCPAGAMFFGVVGATDGYRAHVQVEGFAKVAYTGSELVPGLVKLETDGFGGVRASDDGRLYLVAAVDTEAKTVVIKL